MAAALWARRRVLDESLPSKEKFALPRGFGQAGLRFDAKGLQSRAKILRQLLHPDKHAREGEEEVALWTKAFQALEAALDDASCSSPAPSHASNASHADTDAASTESPTPQQKLLPTKVIPLCVWSPLACVCVILHG